MQNGKDDKNEIDYSLLNYKTAKVYMEREIIVHVSCKNGSFHNGVIVEVTPDFFFIVDRLNGKQLVFFVELSKPIQEYMENEK